MDGSIGYPTGGSFAHRLFGTSRKDFEELFETWSPSGDDQEGATRVDRRLLTSFVRRHVRLLRDVPDRSDEGTFRAIPSHRRFGDFRWVDPGRDVVVAAHFPPFIPHPTSLQFALTDELGESLVVRLSELGFPPPSRDPTFVFGETRHPEGRTTIYAPGPTGVAELVYRIHVDPVTGRSVAVVTCERPPENRMRELIRGYRKAFDHERVLWFRDYRAFVHRDGRVVENGDGRFRVPA